MDPAAVMKVSVCEEAGPTENPPPPALCTAQDRKPIGILTGAAPDYRLPHSGGL